MPAARSSSAATSSGDDIGSVDSDRNRDGWLLTAAAATSFAARLNRTALLGRQRLGSGRRQGEDRHVDALSVHGRDPACTQVFETLLVVAHLVEGETLVANGPPAGVGGRHVRSGMIQCSSMAMRVTSYQPLS